LPRRELTILHRSVERFFTEPEDRALAGVSDSQGVGGSQGQAKADQRAIKRNGEESPAAVRQYDPERNLRWDTAAMAEEAANPPAGPR
jgi:hypothetical protein